MARTTRIKATRIKATWIGLLVGGSVLVTTATCDPRTGAFEFFRDDDNEFFFEDDVHVDDFFYNDFYYDDGYGYFDDCAWGCY